MFDVALDDLREVVSPSLVDGFAQTRVKGVARLLKYLRDASRYGTEYARQERAELTELLGRPVDDVTEGRRAVCSALERGELSPEVLLPYCLRQSARDTEMARDAMGSLADRHATTLGHYRTEDPDDDDS